jgi:hypothetical protein
VNVCLTNATTKSDLCTVFVRVWTALKEINTPRDTVSEQGSMPAAPIWTYSALHIIPEKLFRAS